MRIFKRRSCHGFTLVELLVVIAIIGVLMAVSYPALTSVIRHAQTTKCAGNLHSIGAALLTFASDNDGNFPQASTSPTWPDPPDVPKPDPQTGLYAWTYQISPYVGGNKLVFQCPDSSKTVQGCKTFSYFLGAHAAYAANNRQYAAVNLSRINNASQLILGGDVAFNEMSETDADKDDYTQDPAFNNGGTITIHGGSVNILFADGHIENVRAFDKNSMATHYDGAGYDYLIP